MIVKGDDGSVALSPSGLAVALAVEHNKSGSRRSFDHIFRQEIGISVWIKFLRCPMHLSDQRAEIIAFRVSRAPEPIPRSSRDQFRDPLFFPLVCTSIV